LIIKTGPVGGEKMQKIILRAAECKVQKKEKLEKEARQRVRSVCEGVVFESDREEKRAENLPRCEEKKFLRHVITTVNTIFIARSYFDGAAPPFDQSQSSMSEKDTNANGHGSARRKSWLQKRKEQAD
jgi:hypothetical protein